MGEEGFSKKRAVEAGQNCHEVLGEAPGMKKEEEIEVARSCLEESMTE